MEYIVFTPTSYGIGPTKQRALINLFEELEYRNAEAKNIAVLKLKEIPKNFDFGIDPCSTTFKLIDLDTSKGYKADFVINLDG